MKNRGDINWPEKIRQIKEKGGFTVQELSTELGVHYKSVEYWLYGKGVPSPLSQRAIESLEKRLPDCRQASNEREPVYPA